MPTLVTRPIRRPFNRQRSIRIFLALLGALLIHALLILAVVWIVPHWPRGRLRARSRPIQLTMVSPTAPALEPRGPVTDKPTPPYIRTTDDNASKDAPVDPAFQSSDNSIAASEQPANGDKPLPSVNGKDIPSFDFDSRPFRLGAKAADAATSAPSAEATPLMAVATPPPTPPPVNKKQLPPKSRAPRKAAAESTPATGDLAIPKADALPSPEPPVPTPQDTPKDDENSAPPNPRVGRQPSTVMTNPSTVTSKGAPKPPGYQPQSIPSKMTGNINNRGKPAPAALATPYGRYEKAVQDAIGMRWYMYVDQKMDVISTGTVKIHFIVNRDGRIKDVRVISGKANGELANISLESITEAELEPIPPEVADMLVGGMLEDEISFGVY